MADYPDPSTRSAWKVILPLVLLYAVVNLFAFRLVWMISEGSEWEDWRQIVWRNIAVAFMASEVAVLCMVLVFTPGRFIRRLAFCWAAGSFLGACWLIGYGVVRVAFTDALPGDDVWNVPLSLPLAALLVQAPLWALRVCFGWRWQREPDAPATSEVRWSLADLLVGMALFGVSLGLARLVDPHDNGIWMSWVHFSMYATVFSLFGVGPVMVLTLRGWSWRFGALIFLAYATLAGGLYVALFRWPSPLWRDPEFFLSVLVPPFISLAAGLLLATLVVRSLGYRLICGPTGAA